MWNCGWMDGWISVYGHLFQVYFESDEVHACIVTCGGLCPGLNTVIREIVCGLYYMYGVKRVMGINVSRNFTDHHEYHLFFWSIMKRDVVLLPAT